MSVREYVRVAAPESDTRIDIPGKSVCYGNNRWVRRKNVIRTASGKQTHSNSAVRSDPGFACTKESTCKRAPSISHSARFMFSVPVTEYHTQPGCIRGRASPTPMASSSQNRPSHLLLG
jgi:hypothetical protein